MNAPHLLVVREVQMASMLGYTDFETFRRALRRGDIPAPNEFQGGKPVWFFADIERRYGSGFVDASHGSESDVLEKIDAL